MAGRLGRVCRDAREEAGLRQLEIAMTAGVSGYTISMFEHGRGWKRDVEAIVAAYEKECGLPEDELWRRAIG